MSGKPEFSEDKKSEKTEETEGKEAVTEKKQSEEPKKNKEKKKSSKKETEKLQEKLKESEEKYLRMVAEFQNYKRRAEEEKKHNRLYANSELIVELLNVMDNFERAIASVDESGHEKVGEGINLIYQQLWGVLQKNGVEEIQAENETFDHDKHHAVLSEEAEGVEPGQVLMVMQKGYTLNGKVIRHSMVKVSG